MSPIYRVKIDHESIPYQTVVIKFYGSADDVPYDLLNTKINSIVIGGEGLGPRVLLVFDDSIVYEDLQVRF